MRKGLYALFAVALVGGLATAAVAQEPAGELCTEETVALAQPDLELPAEPSPEPALQIGGQPCGGVTCPVKQYCCNPTCNKCLPFGMSCTLEACNSTPAPSDETKEPVPLAPLEVQNGPEAVSPLE